MSERELELLWIKGLNLIVKYYQKHKAKKKKKTEGRSFHIAVLNGSRL